MYITFPPPAKRQIQKFGFFRGYRPQTLMDEEIYDDETLSAE